MISAGIAQPGKTSEEFGHLVVAQVELLHVKVFQLRWFRHLIRMPPFSSPLGKSNWEEILLQTHNLLKELCIPSGQETPWNSIDRAGKLLQGKGMSVILCLV